MKERVYRVGGHLIASRVALPDLDTVESLRPDIQLESSVAVERHAEPEVWFQSWPPDEAEGRWRIRAAVVGEEFLLRFPGLMDVWLSADGRLLRPQPLQGIPPETLGHLLLDQVLPLAFSLLDTLVVHASAVEVSGQAIVFVGPSGSGKSTLAAWIASSGSASLTDDCLVLREEQGDWRAMPYYAGVRLRPDSQEALPLAEKASDPATRFTTKARLGRSTSLPFSAEARPLRHLFFLCPEDEAATDPERIVEPISQRVALIALVQASFLLATCSPSAIARRFEAIARLVEAVPSSGLRYPRRYEMLERVRAAVFERFRSSWTPFGS